MYFFTQAVFNLILSSLKLVQYGCHFRSQQYQTISINLNFNAETKRFVVDKCN